MKKQKTNHTGGFTLLEIVLALTILAIITVFSIGIANSVRNAGKVRDTKNSMKLIAAKAREFYRGHENLPEPFDPTGPLEYVVPVDTSELNMEPKYRLDAWGQYFYYYRVANDEIDGRPGVIEIDQAGFSAG